MLQNWGIRVLEQLLAFMEWRRSQIYGKDALPMLTPSPTRKQSPSLHPNIRPVGAAVRVGLSCDSRSAPAIRRYTSLPFAQFGWALAVQLLELSNKMAQIMDPDRDHDFFYAQKS